MDSRVGLPQHPPPNILTPCLIIPLATADTVFCLSAVSSASANEGSGPLTAALAPMAGEEKGGDDALVKLTVTLRPGSAARLIPVTRHVIA